MAKKLVPDASELSVNGDGTRDLDTHTLTAAEDPIEQPVRTEELLDVHDLYVDPEEDGLSDIAIRLPARIPITKPAKNVWVTVCPDSTYTRVVVIYEHPTAERSTTFLVAGKDLQEEMRMKYGAVKRRLYLAQDFNKHLFLWPLGLPSHDGTANSWVQSGEQAIDAAKRGWVHISSQRQRQEYLIDVAKPGILPDPQWPVESFDEIFKRAMRGIVLSEGDHPVLRRLREGA
jgi:hypothetical protein